MCSTVDLHIVSWLVVPIGNIYLDSEEELGQPESVRVCKSNYIIFLITLPEDFVYISALSLLTGD